MKTSAKDRIIEALLEERADIDRQIKALQARRDAVDRAMGVIPRTEKSHRPLTGSRETASR